MGAFDPATFLDTTMNEASDTKLVPIPEGEYPAMCGEPSIRTANAKDGSGKVYTFLEIPLEVDSSALTPDGISVATATGRDKNSVRYSAGLEFTPAGGLDMGKGKNVGLGRLREATGLNTPGQPFNFRMFQGRPLKVLIKHRVDGEDIYSEAKGVKPLS